MTSIYNFFSRYPKTIIASVALMTLFFLSQLADIRLDPSMKSMISKSNPVIQNMDLADELFGGSEILIIGVRSDSLFTTSTFEKFEALNDSLEMIDQIGNVMSIYNSSDIISTEDGFTVEGFLDYYPENEEEWAELKEKIKNNDMVYGNIISEDFKSMAFIAQLTSSFDYDEAALKEKIETLTAQFEGPEEIFESGMPLVRANIAQDMVHDMKMFMPFGIFLMIIMLSISFRSWLGVFLPLIVVVISVIWTFGFMAFLGISIPFIGVIIPVMLIAIANDYGIHIIAHYYHYLQEYPDQSRLEIIKKTLVALGVPIFLAGLTTVIGFMSLLGHVLPKVQEVGVFTSIGIIVAFVMSLILIPAALYIAPKPKFLEKKGSMDKMNAFLNAWSNFFIRFKAPFLLFMVVALFIVGLGMKNIVVDTDPDHYYQPDNPIRINNEAITRSFGGSTQISLIVKGDIKDPDVLRQMDQLSDHLQEHPLVSRTFSITDMVRKMHRSFHNDDPEYDVIPDNRELIAQYLFLYSLTGGDASDFDRIIDDIDYPQHAHLLIRLKKVQTSKVVEILNDTEQYIAANFYDLPIAITGAAALMGELATLIVRGQMISLSISLIVVFFIMVIVFRSFVGGIMATIPLMTAIIFVFGLMGYMHIELNMATAMLSSIMIGVGIDYTIHFLWHVREFIREGKDLDTAIASTMKISGKGIVFNAFSVVVGFTVLTLSAFLPVYFFGFLITFSISMCLFGALALLPALISWVNPKFLYK